ncbi:right-handed parallel beta-helix repeat-containing protein [Paenibacillus hodogayensis]|uniref:Right-handed parallel beta-helix repeat-containing protein n=1 Tax=Paenibacillus hodogayensis TaxID=279208 RepID=A0ABV5W6F9_9BACL
MESNRTEQSEMSRRKLLSTLGMAGVALAAGSIGVGSFPQAAEAAQPATLAEADAEFAARGTNVKWNGAQGDGAADDAAAIQQSINDVSAAGGGVVFFPAGTYLIGSTITIPSNITLRGVNAELSVIRDHASLGNNGILSLIGTVGSRLKNIKLRDLTIRNGTAAAYPTLPTKWKDGIVANYVDGLTLERCTLTEVQGYSTFDVKFCTNVYVDRCLFYRIAYCCMLVGPDCDIIKVYNSTFDTLTTVSAPGNAYTFATGNTVLNEGTNWPKNIWIVNNKFLNNPHWEGLDLHGGENVWILNNYIENCYCGINVQNTAGFVSNPVLKNVIIEGNIVKQGSGDVGSNGILVQGVSGIWAEGVAIRNNKIDGFGPTANVLNGGMKLSCMTNFIVENNVIDNYYQSGIVLNYACFEGSVVDNCIKSCAGAFTWAETAAIRIPNNGGGIFGVRIENNTVNPAVLHTDTDLNKFPKYFVACSHQRVSLQICYNAIHNIGTAYYLNPSYMNAFWAAKPTGGAGSGIVQKYGDVIYNQSGQPGWHVSQPTIGYGSLYTGAVTTGSITSGANILTVGSGLTRLFPVGMNIKVIGAGAGGADLSARVVNNNHATQLILHVSASTTVSGADIKYDSLTLVP